MSREVGSRGSVLLMVVGLLTIIAMLGGTFLIIAHLDAKQSRMLAAKSQADPLAEGIVTQLSELLKADLYIDTNGPYGNSTSDAAGWKRFIDYPSESADGTQTIDSWLGSLVPDTIGQWPHLTNITGETNLTRINNVPENAQWDIDGDGPVEYGLVDTDGDGSRDAYLYDTGVTNAEGEQYYAAVRIIDLAGLLCVNTAAEPDGSISPTCPVNIDLHDFLGDLLYNRLHSARCDGASPPLAVYNNQVALRLLQPFGGLYPFGIGDEMYLRWAEPIANNPLTATGRLYEAIGSITDDARRSLTTFNCSRILPRRPAGGSTKQYVLDEAGIAAFVNAGDDSERQEVYTQLLGMFNQLGFASNPEQMAAHFVANLWVYWSGDDPDTQAFEFPAPAGGPTVYGLVPQLVITEAYAYSIAPEDDGSGTPVPATGGYAYAIELYNPTDKDVSVANYQLKCDVSTVDFTGFGITGNRIAAGDWIVLYTFAGKIGGSGAWKDPAASDFDFLGGVPAKWHEVSELDFSEDKVVTIIRNVDGKDIPVDSVAADDFDYEENTVLSSAEEIGNGQRDDDPGRIRCTVAVMKTMTLADMKDHALGEPNGLPPDDADITVEAQYPVQLDEYDSTLPKNLGEFGLVYLTGPRPGTDFPHNIRSFTDTPARGRLDFHPDDIGAAGYTPGSYPDVPPAAMLGEFFSLVPPDPTPPRNLGEFGLVYLTGPRPGTDFPHNIMAFTDTPARGRLDFHPPSVTTGGYGTPPGSYPDVPPAGMLGEFFSLVTPDPTRPEATPDEQTRIYGRVNINTATREVLRQLPWPDTVAGQNVDKDALVDYILAYRDKKPSPPRDYGTRSGAAGADITSLRNTSDFNGFLTPGEIAIPLADYTDDLLGITPDDKKKADYLDNRDAPYRAVSNLITVNSDVYAANILIQLQDPENFDPDKPRYQWRYIVVIDRSNCRTADHSPAVLLFSQVR